MLRGCYCLDPVLRKFKSFCFFYCGANRQRELQTSRQDNSICTGARLKFFPLKFFLQTFEIFTLNIPSALVTADTKF